METARLFIQMEIESGDKIRRKVVGFVVVMMEAVRRSPKKKTFSSRSYLHLNYMKNRKTTRLPASNFPIRSSHRHLM